MAGKITYTEARNLQITKMIRSILSELPNSVYDYILAIADTTSVLSRLGYVHDLRLFMTYLQKENPAFSGKQMISWTEKDIDSVTARDIIMFLDYLTLYFNESDSMVTNHELGKQRKFYSIRSYFKWMYRQGKIKADVTALVDAPKRHEKPILRLDLDEVNKMLNVVANGAELTDKQKAYHKLTAARDKAIISLLLGTGIRVSECAGLDIEDINLEDASFLVTRKGGNQAILYLPDEVISPLHAYIEERKRIQALERHEHALFLSLQNRRMTVRSIENMVKKYALIAAPLKKRISPHKLRSTFGTNLYNETGDIYLVADVLGHSDINTTRRHYAAINEDRRRYAASQVHLGTNNINNDIKEDLSKKDQISSESAPES